MDDKKEPTIVNRLVTGTGTEYEKIPDVKINPRMSVRGDGFFSQKTRDLLKLRVELKNNPTIKLSRIGKMAEPEVTDETS